MSDAAPAAMPRRHDLDALRAFAMILGIALHASLSFLPFPWLVQDLRPNEAFFLVFAAIHGYRMPLFILVSGYFTMMLWRRRGMPALLKQRAWRVLVPCLLGLVTVVPALDWAGVEARRMSTAQDARGKPASTRSELVELIRRADRAGLERALTGGADPNQVDPEFGVPPLSWAAMSGDEPAARLLIDRGADVNGPDKSGYRALHSAAFLGSSEVLDLLIKRGADPKARGRRGDSAVDTTRVDPAMTRAIVEALRIPPPDEDDLQAGRASCRRLLAIAAPGEPDAPEPAAKSGWEGVRQRYAAFLSSERFVVRPWPGGKPTQLFLTSVFHHLWFLWSLCWLVALFAVVAPMAERFAKGRLPARLVTSPLRWLWVMPLTMVPQSLMGSLTPSFGPDTSAGVLPEPHLLLYYAVFFGFGAIYHDADDRDGRLGRLWWLTLPAAMLVLLPLALVTIARPWISGLFQVAYAWAMIFGLIGLFRRCLSRENRLIRYLSDSAYWLYLAHLPVVVLLQAWVRDWDWPAAAKFLVVCTLATASLLASYQVLVRHTPIGRLLNGPRSRPREAPDQFSRSMATSVTNPPGASM